MLDPWGKGNFEFPSFFNPEYWYLFQRKTNEGQAVVMIGFIFFSPFLLDLIFDPHSKVGISPLFPDFQFLALKHSFRYMAVRLLAKVLTGLSFD